MRRKRRTVAIAGVLFVLAAAAARWHVIAQQAGGVEALRARADQDMALSGAYASEPGGTPEEKLWQVLALFGTGDSQPAGWSGGVSISGGALFQLEGYRFELPDRVLPNGGWAAQIRSEKILAGSPIEGSGVSETRVLPKGLLLRGSGTESTEVKLQTNFGDCALRPMSARFGTAQTCLGGRIELRRIPPVTDLSGTELRQHDFPSIAGAADGSAWVTWSSYHDRREELNFRQYRNGLWTRLIPVGYATEDLWRPQAAADETNQPWLIWSQQKDSNWDIYAMPFQNNDWGKLVRLSEDALPDIDPHVTRGPDGAIYVVWQALSGRYSQIRMRYLRGGKWSPPVVVTSSDADDWEPAVAPGSDGRVWIAWDRYNASYDVYTRSYSPGAGLGPEMKVAGTDRYEAHASIAVDRKNRPWIAFETGGANWGKDLGAALGQSSPGQPLGGWRRIEVLCLDNQEWKTPGPFAPKDSLAPGSTGESDPLLFADPNGSVWMAFKRRYSRQGYRPSTYWEHYVTRLDGDSWTEPVPLPRSWTRSSSRMSLTAAGGRLWAFWPSESRNYAFASRPVSNRVIAGSMPLPKASREPLLHPYQPEVERSPAGHPHEASDITAMRAHRTRVGKETLRIVRGDLHRHTELSQDVGGLDDGNLPELYRYLIDVAGMDFGASTDHQGGGTDYWNFITQKMADMFLFPERFVPLYAYERNLGNPHGHRNIVHTQRNYPIVPFFQKPDARFMLPDTPDGELLTFNSMSFGGAVASDTQLLYESLRRTGGLAIPHTSGTSSMGTDWRDNDPKLDPVVEIYQGARQSYEHKNAPRGIQDGEESKALGGFQESGLVWNAWKKGYRIGVIASSDHYSTHISYAMVYTPEPGRQSIFDSIRKRRTYGATDNIVLEFWLGEHFMGDDFSASKKQKVRVKARGTDVIGTIHLIRDAAYIYKVSPDRRDADFEYLDASAGPGEHWYYVRVEQKNGQLAWSSPIWVSYR